MVKSRRVVRKSRKTRGRRLRGGFFGKLFEGFQTQPTMQMQMGDEGTGGATGAQMQAQSNLPVNTGAQVGKVDYSYDAEKPAQGAQMQSVSTVPANNQTALRFDDMEGARAPTAAFVNTPNSVFVGSETLGRETSQVPQTPQTVQTAAAVIPTAPVAPVRPIVPAVRPTATTPPRMPTSRTLLPVKRGGARKSRKGSKSRKGRKGSRRH